jgi:hypothetical protein
MARYLPNYGPFDSTFDSTFLSLGYVPGMSGGQFTSQFDDSFSKRPFFQGAIGGSVFQVAGRSFTIRAHTIPTLKNSSLAKTNRSIFRGNVSRYSEATTSDRDTWEAARFNYPVTVNSGNTRFRNRYHLFISSNQNWSYSNLANKLQIGSQAAPSFFVVQSAILSLSLNTFLVEFTLNAVPAGYAMQIFTSRAISESDPSTARATLRLTVILAPLTTLPIDIYSSYIEVWNLGSAAPPDQIILGIRLIPDSDGQKVSEIGALAQVTA